MSSNSYSDVEDQFVTSRSHAEVDLSHHLSAEAKRRTGSPLKSLFSYMNIPGMYQLAGGTPHPDVFPFHELSAQVLPNDAFSTLPSSTSTSSSAALTRVSDLSSVGKDEQTVIGWIVEKLFGSSNKPKTDFISVPKYDTPENIQLAVALQYGTATGVIQLQKFFQEFTGQVYRPLNANFKTLIHDGNTDAWFKFVQTFCEPGEIIIVEEWTYPSALYTANPRLVKSIGVPMDGLGMRPDALEELLSTWDEVERGAPRPHVMYIVPIGQNPCGTTMNLTRKKELYNICVKYDVIILEDDPYFFLQEGEYVPHWQRGLRADTAEMDDEAWIDSLAPSFLRVDYQGRVVRLETFSKTIAPGSRMGWFTGNPLFIERLTRIQETSTQVPSGFAQSLIARLLVDHWKIPGYIRWLKGLQSNYTTRRDIMMDALAHSFDLQEETAFGDYGLGEIAPLSGTDVKMFVGRSKKRALSRPRGEKKDRVLFSFVAPTSGMFIWLKVHLYNHPEFKAGSPLPTTPEESLEWRLWDVIALQAKILFGPGWIFGVTPEDTLQGPSITAIGAAPGKLPLQDKEYWAASEGGRFGHLRLAFSTVTAEELRPAFVRFAAVLDDVFFPSKSG